MVRADQWQAVHDTFVRDSRKLGLGAWFEANNPTAQAQVMERMVEAIRKGSWGASQEPRREIAARWRDLAAQGVEVGEPTTRAFVADMSGGFGAGPAAPSVAASAGQSSEAGTPSESDGAIPVTGAVMRPVETPPSPPEAPWRIWLAAALLTACLLTGSLSQWRAGTPNPPIGAPA